jgi:peptidoglycan L-alanyl-D-glutamate endopeptidase CwlK
MALPHNLGPKSREQFDTLHPDLQAIVLEGLRLCIVDFSLVEGHRPVTKQFEYFKKGREFKNGRWEIANKKAIITNIDGHYIKGKHNHLPSLAVDFKAYVPDKPELAWDAVHLTYIGASLMLIADSLFREGVITHKLRWGGDWDGDGDLADNRLYDRPHVELYKP